MSIGRILSVTENSEEKLVRISKHSPEKTAFLDKSENLTFADTVVSQFSRLLEQLAVAWVEAH